MDVEEEILEHGPGPVSLGTKGPAVPEERVFGHGAEVPQIAEEGLQARHLHAGGVLRIVDRVRTDGWFLNAHATFSWNWNNSMVMAFVGQRSAHSAQRMQRSSSLMMALVFTAESPSSWVRWFNSSVGRSFERGTILRQSSGHTSTQPPQRMQREESKTVFTLQERQ